MAKKIIRPHGMYDPSPRGYSHAVKAGNTVYIAGQLSVKTQGKEQLLIGAGDVAAQARNIFAGIERIVRAAGGDMGDIVEMRVFLKDIRDLPKFLEVRKEVFRRDFPASTAVQVAAFALPDALVEVSAIAVL